MKTCRGVEKQRNIWLRDVPLLCFRGDASYNKIHRNKRRRRRLQNLFSSSRRHRPWTLTAYTYLTISACPFIFQWLHALKWQKCYQIKVVFEVCKSARQLQCKFNTWMYILCPSMINSLIKWNVVVSSSRWMHPKRCQIFKTINFTILLVQLIVSKGQETAKDN